VPVIKTAAPFPEFFSPALLIRALHPVKPVRGRAAASASESAVARGAHVFVTSSSQEKIQKAVELGATGGISYKANQSSPSRQARQG
jgi:hypothetical protein